MQAFKVELPSVVPKTLTTVRKDLTAHGIHWEEKESCDVDGYGNMCWMTRIVLTYVPDDMGQPVILWFNGQGDDAELIWVSEW